MRKLLKSDLTVTNPPQPRQPSPYREAWTIDFHDRTSVIVFTYDTMVAIVRKTIDHVPLHHGNTKKVHYQLIKWMDDDKGYEILSSVEMDIKLI